MRASFLLGPAVFAALSIPLRAGEVVLVRDHQPQCVIVANAGPSAAFAAKDLKFHLDRMAGCDVPMLTPEAAAQAKPDLTRIILGDGPLAAQYGVSSDKLEPEAYRIKIVPGAVVIVGKDVQRTNGELPSSPAVMYGTSHLLDRLLGVRWLWPGDLGTYIPAKATVTLPETDIIAQPPFSLRSFTTQVTRTVERSSTTRKTGDEAILWNHHHTIGRGRTDLVIGHSFGKWWEKYHDTHPEYFAKMPPGRQQAKPELVKLCVSEPGVARQIIAEWKEAGSPECWNVCPNDGGGFCVCDRCRKLDGVEQDPLAIWDAEKVDLNARYIDLWNRLLVEMKKTRPDVLLCAYSYSVYKNLKPGTHVEPGLVIEFVGGTNTRDLWKTWANAGVKIALRPNWLHFGGVAPHLALHEMGEYFAFAQSNGMLQFHFDSNFGHYGTQGPNYYLLARMGSRPDLGVDAIIDEWCSAFGSAAPQVRRYLDYWEKYAAEVSGKNKDGLFYKACLQVGMRKPSSTVGSWRTLPQIYPDAKIQPGLALLDEATAAAANDEIVKARIQFLRDGLLHVAALRDVVALTQGKERDVRERIPLIQEKGKALLELERELTPRHVVYEAVLRSIYDKRGVQPFASSKPIRIEGL